MRYKTQLRFKVLQAVQETSGLLRVRGLARKLGENASSVLYQLKRLISDGIARKLGRYYVAVSWLCSHGGKRVAQRILRELKFKQPALFSAQRDSLSELGLEIATG